MNDWTPAEVRAIVSTYLRMLTLELSGQKYVKTKLNAELMQILNGRSKGSVEFKHCNISAALTELGMPSIRGYKPRFNFQRRLIFDELSLQLPVISGLDEAACNAVETPAYAPDIDESEFAEILLNAPKADTAGAVDEMSTPHVAKRDYLALEARNRSLGLAGERLVLEVERWRLKKAGCTDLADNVEHTSEERGDGAGYDIKSFDISGKPRFIEVKTTAYNERTPFWISSNEVLFASNNETSYQLARVYDFRHAPKIFYLGGDIRRHCLLDPSTYKASLRAASR